MFYRNADGRQRTITLGRTDLLKAEQARAKARQLLVDVQNGADPSQARRERRKVVTMTHLWEDYLSMYARPRKKAASVRGDETLWRLHLEPVFGGHRVEALSIRDITAFHVGMSDRRGAANRALALLSKMLSLAVEWELRADNPCRKIERYPENRKERFLTVEEAKRLNDVLDREVDVGGVTALRLLLLTGARRSEVLSAVWGDFDLTEGAAVWTVPREAMKGATRVRCDLRRPLSEDAAKILREWREVAPQHPDDLVFPSRLRPLKRRTNLQDLWERVREAAGLTDVRVHDLRHSFASAAVNAGVSLHLVGRALGHRDLRTTERYAHLQDESLRGVATAVSNLFPSASA